MKRWIFLYVFSLSVLSCSNPSICSCGTIRDDLFYVASGAGKRAASAWGKIHYVKDGMHIVLGKLRY